MRTRIWAAIAAIVGILVVLLAILPLLAGAATRVDELAGTRNTLDTGPVAPEPSTGSAPAVFADESVASGADTEHKALGITHEGRRLIGYPTTGQAWADYDRDGRLDLYLTNQVGPNSLYRGADGGGFSPSPLSAAVALPTSVSGGASFADYDNDGWPDLYVAAYGHDTLFHNDAGQGFTDVTGTAGVAGGDTEHGMTASWADYDEDGFLDLYIANHGCEVCNAPTVDEGSPDRLYHNGGDGTFTDVTALLPGDAGQGWGFVGGWLDYDEDGDSDLYMVNNVRGTRYLPANTMYRNDGPGCGGRGTAAGGAGGAGEAWCFTDVTVASGTNVRMDGMGIAVGDYDGDQHLDIFATNTGWSHNPLTGPQVLLRSDGDGTFTDVSAGSGSDIDAIGWGTVPLDYDNDGRLDLYVSLAGDPEGLGDHVRRNRLLHGHGDGTFSDVTATSGASPPFDSLGSATADYNGDGWTDIVVGNPGRHFQLFANTGSAGTGAHRLAVRLTGGGPINRDAVGARVYVTTPDGRTQVREVISGSSLGGGSDLTMGIGLGSATSATVRVLWPDGTEQTFADVASNVRWQLTYGGAPTTAALAPLGVGPTLTGAVPTTSDVRPGGWLVPALALLAVLGLAGAIAAGALGLRRFAFWLTVAVGIGALTFQLLHVLEHLLQLGYWTRHPAEPPWITPWGRVATDGFSALAGHEHAGRASGFELLHLAGGVICLTGLLVSRRLMRDHNAPAAARRTGRFALGLELVHVTEHLSLSLSSLFLHVPVGISTLFGASFLLPGAWATSIRLLFHFAMNLTVTTLALVALWLWWRGRRALPVGTPPAQLPVERTPVGVG